MKSEKNGRNNLEVEMKSSTFASAFQGKREVIIEMMMRMWLTQINKQNICRNKIKAYLCSPN